MALRSPTIITISAVFGETKTVGLLSPEASYTYNFSMSFTDGAASGSAQKVATYSTTVVSGAPVTLDLTAAAGGPFGNVNFSKMKVMIAENLTAAGGGNLLIGAAASNQFSDLFGDPTDKIKIVPGEAKILMLNPVGSVVDGTHKSLKIDSDSATVTYKLILIGEGT